MTAMRIRAITPCDAPAWIRLAHEYDDYIRELAGDLTEWYNGNETDDAFDEYIHRKIQKKEAAIVYDHVGNTCLGVVGFSATNNRITFFGISCDADFSSVSRLLIRYALRQLDCSKRITVNIVRHNAEAFQKEREAFSENGFSFEKISTENGIPVDSYCREGDC